MNDAVGVPAHSLLSAEDLAARPDFTLGQAAVSPSSRTIAGPGGTADVEPRVMQVLLVLAEVAGQVVTRGTLFDRCWGGVFVGDDSLNRVIAAIRKLAAEVAGGSFEIETIPRTGYRLNGKVETLGEPQAASHHVSRRTMIASTVGITLAGVAGAGLWSLHLKDRRFEDYLQRGEESLEYGDGSPTSAEYLRHAVALRPGDPAAQGLLAFALMTNTPNTGGTIEEAEGAVDSALRLSPQEPNARLAQIELQRTTLDIARTEDGIRSVLATAPKNIFAMRLLWNLLQSAGRSRDALAVVERAMANKPLAATANYPLAQMLWIVGRTAEADRVIDRALDYWPDHPYVRYARFTILAWTGRARTALAMLDNAASRPQGFTPQSIALWRVCLAAVDQASPANLAKARAASLQATEQNPALSSQAILALSTLNQIDAAYQIANNLLVFLAPDPGRQGHPLPQQHGNSTAWRFTPWLFTPPAAPMRADPRFAALADGIGLTAYWRARKIRPDYLVFG